MLEEITRNPDNIMQKLEVGDIFFIKASLLKTWGVSHEFFENEGLTMYGTIRADEEIIYVQGEALLAVKYLGNKIFKEMTTGETIIGKDKIKGISNYTFITTRPKQSQNPQKFLMNLEEMGNQILNHPLAYDCYGPLIKINELTKRIYLQTDNKMRKKLLEEKKRLAMKQTKKIFELISQIMERPFQIPKVDYDMADLENQLYDFAHENPTKKLTLH